LSANDILALKTEYRNWKNARAVGLTEVDPFEFFCADQFLKSYLLTDEDILSGVVGSSNDGGVDAFYFLLNGHLVQEDTVIPTQPNLPVSLVFVQSKENEGFSPLSVDRFDTLTDDLLDLLRPPGQHRRTYNSKLLSRIRIFKEKYAQLSMPKTVVDYYYVTCADVDENEDCRGAASRVIETAKKHFSRAEVHPFHFINGARLYTQLGVRPPRTRNLLFTEWVSVPEGWIGLIGLRDFYTFLQDEEGHRNENIFDDNVRGVQETKINESIYHTLTKPQEMPEFWLLNNGITILSPKAQPKTHKLLEVTDPQIVNGLQTSRQIFNYFSNEYPTLPGMDNRRILVKVIQNSDDDVRDTIIRATNNQNPCQRRLCSRQPEFTSNWSRYFLITAFTMKGVRASTATNGCRLRE